MINPKYVSPIEFPNWILLIVWWAVMLYCIHKMSILFVGYDVLIWGLKGLLGRFF